jgi:hypothetical protein
MNYGMLSIQVANSFSIYSHVLGFIYIYALLIPFLFDTAVTATGLIWSRYSTVITPVSFVVFSKADYL